MKCVYLLQSISRPDQRYIGLTSDLDTRLKEHDAARSPHTARFAPWRLVVAIQFQYPKKAAAFERYLKTGSGRAFAKRRFW